MNNDNDTSKSSNNDIDNFEYLKKVGESATKRVRDKAFAERGYVVIGEKGNFTSCTKMVIRN